MIAKLLIASLLTGTSAAGVGQEAARTADGSTSQWSYIHQCTLAAVSNFAINTKGTGAHSGRAISGSAVWTGPVSPSRIDLQVTGSPGGSPTIGAHAINTKGTGAAGRSINEIGISVKSKRMSGAQGNRSPIGVACVSSPVSGDAAAQKASLVDFHFTSHRDESLGWSCSVSGSEDQPMFSVGLLVPTILGQAERVVFTSNVATAHSGVSIVPRGAAPRGSESFACSSKEPRGAGYDLVMMKKV